MCWRRWTVPSRDENKETPMITLRHLTVERFRLLHHIDLHFPQRGSVLIQGPNEAGKSALLESIYFALYGEPLNVDRGRRIWLDDLVQYGEHDAVVSLVFHVEMTEMAVQRTIEREKGQRVVLRVRRLNASSQAGPQSEEIITRLGSANERILVELGRIDAETMRNSCILEQKGLERLERLRGSERESTARRLLGIEKLTRLNDQFKVTPQDERLLEDCHTRLRLAEVQAHIPGVSKRLETLEAALDALTVSEELAAIVQQRTEIAEEELALEQVATRRSELKSQQSRVQQLKRADATLGEIIASYDLIAEANHELPLIEKQIAELSRREREELPSLERRVSELVELTKSFGTLQRMSEDLLTTVDTIKELEQELVRQDEAQDELKGVNEQLERARYRVVQAQRALLDAEEQQRSGRPLLEERIERLRTLSQCLATLRQREEQYAAHLEAQKHANQSGGQLEKVKYELHEAEEELAQAEDEANQLQQQVEQLEKQRRQLNVRGLLEEWQRLKGPTQELVEAEQQVRAAHDHQAQLTERAMEARRTSARYLGFTLACVILFLLSGGAAIAELSKHTTTTSIIGAILGLLALLMAAGAGFSFQNYNKARRTKQEVDIQVQDAISKVGTVVAARETAARTGGNVKALARIEHELRALTGTLPRSIGEAQSLLQQSAELSLNKGQGEKEETIADLQERMKRRREEAEAAGTQVRSMMEAMETLRKHYMQLEEQISSIHDIETQIHDDQVALNHLHQEILLLAGQEGLPQSSINARLQRTPTFDTFSSSPLTPIIWHQEEDFSSVPDLDALVESTIKATEHELVTFDGKDGVVRDLERQVKIHQDALDVTLLRRKSIEEQNTRFQAENPRLQLQRVHEQQVALRSALQSLQESLRQRVKSLNVPFGQTAISNAEAAARKELEQLNVVLGDKYALEGRRDHYTHLLKERQELLAERYKQLAKFSNTLGSWIVPANPFTEVLVSLRGRCKQELDAANESAIAAELEQLMAREGASHAKIALCQQEIEETQEQIAAMLTRYNRPQVHTYTFTDVVVVWPLLAEYSAQDRPRLESEREECEKELTSLEREELDLSTRLQTGSAKLDLAVARLRLEQQERSYQAKKRGGQLLKTASQHLMTRIVPHTEYHMQRLLPLLTGGRYHDVRLSTESEEGTVSGGPLRLRVWDSAAGEYVSKSALSGGTADQLSLALRLAFAIATLPRELETAPAFLILDEPLSSFDKGRIQALIDVVTGDALGRYFEQILLISHSSAFDPALFPYHLYIDNGQIVESNLPIVPSAPTTPTTEPLEAPSGSQDKHTEDSGDVSDMEDIEDVRDVTVRVAAIPRSVGA